MALVALSDIEERDRVMLAYQAVLRLGRDFDDEVIAAAMVDRLVHHADIVALKGDRYRSKTATFARANQRLT